MSPTKTKPTPERIKRGERIQEAENCWLREGQHRTVRKLVHIIGVSEPAYYSWKNASVKEIAAGNLLKLCSETRFNPFYILWGHKPKRTLDNPVMESLLRELDGYSDDQLIQLLKYAKFLKSSPPAK